MFGSFAMVPFCNRLKPHSLNSGLGPRPVPRNWPSEHCAIHGLGWFRPWTVCTRSETECELTLEIADEIADAAGGLLGLARQRIELTAPNAARLSLAFENRLGTWLDVGLGFHPWFHIPDAPDFPNVPAGADASLRFAAEACLAVDPALHPADLQPLPEPESILTARRNDNIDSTFIGWNGNATLKLPQCAGVLRIRSDAPCLHVYIDAARRAFCVEPVSHVPNATHDRRWRERYGMTRIAPGETQTMFLALELDA